MGPFDICIYIRAISPIFIKSMPAFSFLCGLKFRKSRKAARPLFQDECVVCLETEKCLSTSKCKHPICTKCLGDFIITTHNSSMPCPCPSSAICTGKFTVDDITPLVDNDILDSIWLAQAEGRIREGLGMYCTKRECSRPILWDVKTAKRQNVVGICRSCGEVICISCKTPEHNGLTYRTPLSKLMIYVDVMKIKCWRY